MGNEGSKGRGRRGYTLAGSGERLLEDDGRGDDLGGGGGEGEYYPPPDPQKVQQLVQMGFSENDSVRALQLNREDITMASSWLLSNPSAGAGSAAASAAERRMKKKQTSKNAANARSQRTKEKMLEFNAAATRGYLSDSMSANQIHKRSQQQKGSTIVVDEKLLRPTSGASSSALPATSPAYGRTQSEGGRRNVPRQNPRLAPNSRRAAALDRMSARSGKGKSAKARKQRTQDLLSNLDRTIDQKTSSKPAPPAPAPAPISRPPPTRRSVSADLLTGGADADPWEHVVYSLTRFRDNATEAERTARILMKIVKNCLEAETNAEKEKYGRLRLSNPKINALFAQVDGGVEALVAIGFKKRGDDMFFDFDNPLSMQRAGLGLELMIGSFG